MRLRRFDATQVVPVPLDQAWSFFSDASNLPRITPPWLDFRLESELPERAHAGMIAVYRVRVAPGVRVRWVTEITHLEAERFFVDEQRFGPYRFWHHQHHFRAVDSGTEIRDIVHYAVPLGPLGRVVDRVRIAAQVEEIFAFRRQVLIRILGEESATASGR